MAVGLGLGGLPAAAAGTAVPPAAPLPAAAGAPAAADGAPIRLPSGAEAHWLDTITDRPGPAGLTFRYRFVMPALAELVPATSGPASEELTDADRAELDALGVPAPGAGGDGGMMDMGPAPEGPSAGDLAEAELVTPEELDLPDFPAEAFEGLTEGPDGALAGDGTAEGGAAEGGDIPVPADPDLLLQDPVHDDVTWLCERWVLPRLAPPPAPQPAQIIISLADRPTRFGVIDMEAVQLFEAYSITPDRRSCHWEPW